MDYALTSKVALIVGGTSGIGLAVARAFAASGARIVLSSRNREKGKTATDLLRSVGDEATFFECDVSDSSSVNNLLRSTVDHFGRLDCAVNSAAYEFKLSRTHEVKDQEVADQLAVDVQGVFSCMRAEIAAMLPNGGGTIVNVASITGLSGTPSAALYSAGKHAVIGLTRSAAKEYISDGIRINSVCPGITDTPRQDRRIAHLSEVERVRHKAALASDIPIGRLATAEEIANAILWLSSPVSSYVVGHSLVIDGGLSA
ncbi:glucose 1-dehydrogenase [Rhodanobacter sp. MP1X3]|jgi:NAD(P)-dependent dehydrogenase (short-subunit alcohol dehydrogenase family)|uniref:SDR family NAD(P)-dependent oxidoreductase n=1 Tax=Rhodanobacter sp. MP1X3 TaxID=2723086 RepID=UPI0016175B11|nr:glucose 1-dehydrogenase [Rhodanobacter sp. MP1X3]MBB6242388.1 NAD(P)-dependent dehydrogenase (short-subunit alcohol dehydrogenase family) [Rhodanobacter sp. MP1X3]